MFDDGSPIYRQIAAGIQAQILDGTLAADQAVMSTNQYAAFYRINPATVAKAFQHLVDAGLLYKRRGIGMFVSPDAAAQLKAQHRERFFSDVVTTMARQAQILGIALDDVILHLQNLAKEPKS